jgi:hypothetical protein
VTTRAWSVPLGALVHEHCNGPLPDVFHNGREEIRQPDADGRESGTSQLISFLKLDAYIRFLQTKLRFATA